MHSTHISRLGGREDGCGFTLVELLVGLSIAVCLATAIAPLWLGFQRAGEGEADATIWFLQGRIAVARFERDLRLAGAANCGFSVAAPVLQASPSQVVFLQAGPEESAPLIVEWEVANGALMRRWGPSPQTRPAVFLHSMYADSKTMLDSLRPGSCFGYLVKGRRVAAPVAEDDLVSIDTVVLDLAGDAVPKAGAVVEHSVARVAR